MKTNLRLYVVLMLGLFAFSCAISQKTTSEYDDMYYIPSEKKAVEPVNKQEQATQQKIDHELSDYEKYLNSLENQGVSKAVEAYAIDTVEYADDQNYLGSEYYEEDGNTYVTNNYYNTDDYYYTSRIRRFYDPYYSFSYYDPFFYDPFWYGPGWSMNMTYGYPYGFGFSYGWPYSSWYWGSPYYYSYNPYYGYNPYGYYGGYYGGYYDYGYSHYYGSHFNQNNDPNKPVYYGPRRTIENNRIASSGNAGSFNGRRVSSASGTYRSANDATTVAGRRPASSGNVMNNNPQNGGSVATGSRRPVSTDAQSGTGTVKSTGTGSTTVRRPYGTVNSGTSNNTDTYRRTSTGTTNVAPSTRNQLNSGDNLNLQNPTRSSSVATPQERPVYTRPSSTVNQSRPSYSGATPSQNRSVSTEKRSSTYYDRPSSSSSSSPSYSRPSSSSSSSPSYSRPSSSSSPTYSRPSSSSGSSSSSGGSRSSYSSGSSGSSSHSSGSSSSSSGSSSRSSGSSSHSSGGRR